MYEVFTLEGGNANHPQLCVTSGIILPSLVGLSPVLGDCFL